MINGICGTVEDKTMFTIHHLLHGVDSLVNHTLVESDASHSTPSLTLDEYLTLLILIRTNLIAIEVVGAEIPFTVPTVLLHSLVHTVDCLVHSVSLGIEISNTIFCCILTTVGKSATELNIFLTCDDEESGNHKRFCLSALTIVLGGLETLVGIPREAVEVETVIPVGTTYEGKS